MGARFGRRTRVAIAVAVASALGATGCSDGGSDDGDVATFCRQYERLTDLVEALGTEPEELDDVPGARALADDLDGAARALAEAPPEEIANEARRLAGVTAAMAGELAGFYGALLDDPARAGDPAFVSGFRPLTEERRSVLEESGDAVRGFAERRCDAPDPTTTEPPATTSPADT